MKEVVFVVGGAGFIGSWVAEKLLETGKYDVIVVDNLSNGKEENIPNDAYFEFADIRDIDKMIELFRNYRPRMVFHLAAKISISYSYENPDEDAFTNIIASISLAELSAKFGVKKFIFSSSAAVYGEQENFPANEEDKKEPFSPYGIGKLAFEYYLRFFYKEKGLRYVSLRYSNVYGPRQDAKGEAGVVAIFVERLIKGEEVVIYGDGKQTRDFIYVEDVARANLLAANSDFVGEVNISTSKETSINELYSLLRGILGVEREARYLPPRKGDVRRSVLSNKKAQEVIGFSVNIPLKEGLSYTINWFKDRLGG